MKHLLLTTTVIAGTLVTGSAFASNLCNVAKADWQPREALQQKLTDAGWKVKRIKTEDGCYEAYAIDDTGRKVEAYFDPQTLVAVKSKVEG